ncbi:GTPase ObgE [Nitriliruptoraceae bacterium ZYF776]|nr:GTPase ObgE [Profundirhabdus halotolerans]
MPDLGPASRPPVVPHAPHEGGPRRAALDVSGGPDRPPARSPVVDQPSFVDECTVHLRGGHGGNGSVSFRREKHVPRGGPDGGDGGRGGDIVLVADDQTSSLLDLHRRPHRRAGDGAHGSGMQKDGAAGRDELIRVPVGTVVRDGEDGSVLADLVDPGQRFVAAAGGRGGRGNVAFATRYRRIPRFAERGEKVAERRFRLELKLIADVGLVGFPSAGKSSLVGRLSAARPRVEAWPFTTLTPHLGVMRAGNGPDGTPTDVVLADVPGLIEGAAEGKGLGLTFLRHIERCLVLLHVLDTAPFETDRDPVRDLATLRAELAAHDPSLLERPQLVALNKVDLPDGVAMAELVADQLRAAGEDVVEVSAVAGTGLDPLRYRLGELVRAERSRLGDEVRRVEATPGEVEVVLRPARQQADFHIERDDTGAYVVRGRRFERWVQMLPLEERDAVLHLQGRLRRAGVDAALVAAGAREGDEVVIGEVVFDFAPELEHLPEDERLAILAAEAHEDDPDAATDPATDGAVDDEADA